MHTPIDDQICELGDTLVQLMTRIDRMRPQKQELFCRSADTMVLRWEREAAMKILREISRRTRRIYADVAEEINEAEAAKTEEETHDTCN